MTDLRRCTVHGQEITLEECPACCKHKCHIDYGPGGFACVKCGRPLQWIKADQLDQVGKELYRLRTKPVDHAHAKVRVGSLVEVRHLGNFLIGQVTAIWLDDLGRPIIKIYLEEIQKDQYARFEEISSVVDL